MAERYWLIHRNGGRQLIDPRHFDLPGLFDRAREVGGSLVVETSADGIDVDHSRMARPRVDPIRAFEPPVAALGALFRVRLARLHRCVEAFDVDINTRPTTRVLGSYYRGRRLVRVYSHDRKLGRRPLEELFDTFLHEVAHHLEYTEPTAFRGLACGRVPGRMHSPLFWRILGELKGRWIDLQRPSGT